MFELAEDKKTTGAVIKVIGVGGCGGNTVNYMMSQNLEGVEFICANTDMQALSSSKAHCIQLGADLTKGLGAGGDPEVGRDAAKESAEQIRQIVENTDMVFITAGMGGGTGSGASPEIAEIAKTSGALTVAVVTKPFAFDVNRMEIAEQAIDELSRCVDSLIIISNEKLITVYGADALLEETMEKGHDVLCGAVQGIAELITRKGLMNLDFADIRAVMSEPGRAMISSGSAEGEGRVQEALLTAIQNPLLEDMDLNDVRGLLVNVSGGDITAKEIHEIGSSLMDLTADKAKFKMGVVIDGSMGDAIRITVVATGIGINAESTSVVNETTVEAIPDPVVLKTTKGNDESLDKTPQSQASSELSDEKYNELLDIPSFLREQVD